MPGALHHRSASPLCIPALHHRSASPLCVTAVLHFSARPRVHMKVAKKTMACIPSSNKLRCHSLLYGDAQENNTKNPLLLAGDEITSMLMCGNLDVSNL